jgi:hypothetical protein
MSAFDLAARYLAGVDADGSEQELEERLFQDEALMRAADWLLELRAALRDLSAGGPVVPVVTAAELAALAVQHRVREFVPVEQTIDASVAREVEFVAARLPIQLGGARSIDVELCTPAGVPYFRVHEAPYDPASNEVIVLCHRHVALAAANLRLVIRDERGVGRGEFTLLTREAPADP